MRGKDWIRIAPALHGVERLAARFHGHAYDWHRHDTYAIGLTLQGVQTFDYRRTTHNSLARQVMVLHPDERHNGRAGSETGFAYWMMYVEPSHIRQALNVLNLPFVPRTVSDDPSLARTVAAAFRSFPDPLPELESDSIIARVAEQLLRRSDSKPTLPRSSPAKQIMEQVRTFLAAEFKLPVSSGELETLTGLDRYAIAHHFRHCFGTSPYRYLLMRQLTEARKQIVQGYPIVTVAIDLGFADQSHLTRCFHQMFGLPPGRLQRLCGSSHEKKKIRTEDPKFIHLSEL